MFWTDTQQATERLQNSFVLYDDEPVYVERIADGDEPLAVICTRRAGRNDKKSIKLSDEKFHNFRKLPSLGWVNFEEGKTALYLSRRPRRSRIHGLNSDNCSAFSFSKDALQAGRYDIFEVFNDEGYKSSCKNDYPSLDDILKYIKEGTALALSPQYAVYRDESGLRWLFREKDRVGLFSGTNTLLLIKAFSYVKEELTESSVITVDEIKEF